MPIRFPAPLRPGDRIGVTAPSTGVEPALRPRLNVAIAAVKAHGFDVVVGDCMDGSGVVSAPAVERAAELQAMLTDSGIRAVVPPWGRELAVEILPHLDFRAIATAEPTWLVGYSDIATLLVPLTTLTGVATLHGQNLLDTPFRVPEPLVSWLDLVTRPAGSMISQGASSRHRGPGFDDFAENPQVTEWSLEEPGGWRLLDPDAGPVRTQGRLIGGCIETVSTLAGTEYGDLQRFADRQAPEGLIVYVEASGDAAIDIARDLWRMRLVGWFDRATAVLVARTHAPDSGAFTQTDAVHNALGDLAVPVVIDVDCGHVPPHLALVNGALAEVVIDDAGAQTITQTLG